MAAPAQGDKAGRERVWRSGISRLELVHSGRYALDSAIAETPGCTMPRTVDIADAKARFSQLIALAEMGEDVIIARDGVPVARIVPVARPISETIALMRKERAQRMRVAAADARADKEHGRA